MNRIFRKRPKKAAIEILIENDVWNKNPQERAMMTVSCRDTDYIPKAKDAGKTVTFKGRSCQVMHNGLKVVNGGYYGEWMSGIIKSLNGHHEPQEEKTFYEVLKRLDKKPTMIELGSFWAYYSNWLAYEHKDATIICCEPDPKNIEVGKINAEINGNLKRATFIESAAGSKDKSKITFDLDSEAGKTREVEIRSIDSIVREYKIKKLDVVHMDVQGAELDALKGAEESIKQGKVRFVFVSTHHYLFSKDPSTHQKCKDFIRLHGGNIITSHTIAESFSGDGLIVASFDKRDNDLKIEVSNNSTDDSLFRPYELDLNILLDHINKV